MYVEVESSMDAPLVARDFVPFGSLVPLALRPSQVRTGAMSKKLTDIVIAGLG